MVRTLATLVLVLLLGVLPMTVIATQAETTADIAQLEKDVYRYYNTDSVEQLDKAVKRLKHVCLEVGDEKTFYKTWSNQAIFYFTRVNRAEGLRILEEVKAYAKYHNSKFGLYTATFVMSTMMTGVGNLEEAEKNLLWTIDYLHNNFPGESAAASYLALAKIEHNRQNYEKSMECADNALKEPGINMQHQLTAWSYRCMGQARIEKPGSDQEFLRLYAEREKVKEAYGHDDNFGYYVKAYYELANKRFDKALAVADEMKGMGRLETMSFIYEKMGDYKQAFSFFKQYKHMVDSANSEAMRKQAHEMATEMGLFKAQSETRGLRSKLQYLLLSFVTIALLVLVVYIIRRRKQMLHLQTLNHKLEHALAVKGSFLNNISHEMRTPLNSISGFTEILTMPGMELPQEEKDDLGQRVKESTVMLTSIIDKMLELTYYDGLNTLELTDEVVVDDFCRKLVADYESQVVPGVVLAYTSQLSTGLTVRTAVTSLERVMRHVLDNAVQFTQKGSITLSTSTTDDMLVFSVSDTGPGIPFKLQKTVFERFVDTGEQLKTVGIGLSISRTICTLLGGDISIDPKYLLGCRVVVCIPL
jgi:signal transduction histidine kinase